MKEISFKKAISIGLAAGLIIGAAGISASAAGFAKQWFGNISKTAVQQELPSDGTPIPDGTPTPDGTSAPNAAEGGASTGDGTIALPTEGLKPIDGFGRHGKAGKGGHLNLESLVEDGVIDQATADRISEYIANKKDILSEMVDDGVITQAQADAITAAQPERGFDKGLSGAGIRFEGGIRGKGVDGIRFNIDALVSSGLIDQATVDKVTEFLEAEKAAKIGEMETLRNMTESERAEYIKNKVAEAPKDVLTKLVDAGILTQAQADAVEAAVPTISQTDGHRDHMGRGGGFPGAVPDGTQPGTVPAAPEGGSTTATNFL
ncbi:hypothetical protein FACS1894127_3130 [Clostridia bacterium]|nr:hypothetical protein FACS1894127_3130 [Clostridia bacterium]